jgi:hypothetical protein
VPLKCRDRAPLFGSLGHVEPLTRFGHCPGLLTQARGPINSTALEAVA